MLKLVLNHLISKKIGFYVNNAYLKMIRVLYAELSFLVEQSSNSLYLNSVLHHLITNCTTFSVFFFCFFFFWCGNSLSCKISNSKCDFVIARDARVENMKIAFRLSLMIFFLNKCFNRCKRWLEESIILQT